MGSEGKKQVEENEKKNKDEGQRKGKRKVFKNGK